VPVARLVSVVAVSTAALVLVLTSTPAAARAVDYVPPVSAPVIDPFRPPSTPFGPGNRGLDYDTTAGQAVTASADGEVVFAGDVAGTLHVTVRHADGLRTSYSFLDSIVVSVGQPVRQGDPIGTASARFHFGVRDPDGNYLDPARLFSGELHPQPHLIPGADDGEPSLATTASEGQILRALVSDRVAAAIDFGNEVAGELDTTFRAGVQSAVDLTSHVHLDSVGRDMAVWYLAQGRCTSASTPLPPPAGRRILVEVGGLGSTSEQAAVDRVDRSALGYAPGDVIRFSYNGGHVPESPPPGSPLGSLPTSRYSPVDTEHDLTVSAAQLDQLLQQVAAAEPGVPIDVVAHSQGGVIGRLALEQTRPPPPVEVQTLVTLGAPHHGTNLATALADVRSDRDLQTALSAAYAAGTLPLDPDGASLAQLAEGSSLIDQMNARPLAPGVRLLSVGASNDLTVPAPRTLVDGAGAATVVSLGGLHAHDDLPGSPAATREIGWAVRGLAPTCRPFAQALEDAVASETIDTLEDNVTATAAWAPQLVAPGPTG
jgi:hypothetical protein